MREHSARLRPMVKTIGRFFALALEQDKSASAVYAVKETSV